MNIDITEEDSKFMYGFVQGIIEEVGPRMPCSPQEAKAAEIIKREFEKSCDKTIIESFSCHPKAFLGWIKLDMVFVILSFLLYLLSRLLTEYIWLLILSICSFILIFLPFLIMWEEFFNYKEFIDPIFRKKTSQNVIGSFKPKGELKKIIIFSSHLDSAIEFKLLKLLGWGFIPLAFGAILIMLMWLVLSCLNLIFIIIGLIKLKSLFFNVAVWTLIIGSPCFIGLFFFVPLGDKGNVVPGAVDNLSSCSVVQGLGRYLKKHRDIIPDNTEVRLISFGCEESGLRGAYRYATAHLEELQEYDANIVNMDGLETPDGFYIIEFEPTTRTWHSEEVIQKLLKASEDMGIEAKRFGAGKLEKTLGRLSGGSDAAAFSKADIKAASIVAMILRSFLDVYHQPSDTIEHISEEALVNVLKILIGYLINESKKK